MCGLSSNFLRVLRPPGLGAGPKFAAKGAASWLACLVKARDARSHGAEKSPAATTACAAMASSSRPRLLFGGGGGGSETSEAAGSAVSSAGPSADSGREGPPAGFFVTLVVGAVVLCALLCCLRRLIRTGADHLHRQQAARHSPMRDEGAQQQRASIAANIVASLTPHIAATAAQELCAAAEEEQLNPTGDADDGTSTVFSARESDAIM